MYCACENMFRGSYSHHMHKVGIQLQTGITGEIGCYKEVVKVRVSLVKREKVARTQIRQAHTRVMAC
jgi:hypothetical protein